MNLNIPYELLGRTAVLALILLIVVLAVGLILAYIVF